MQWRKRLTHESSVPALILVNVHAIALHIARFYGLNSRLFLWFYGQMTHNPVFAILAFLLLFAGPGGWTLVKTTRDGNTITHYYAYVPPPPGYRPLGVILTDMFTAIFDFSRGGLIKTVGFLLALVLLVVGTSFVSGDSDLLPEASAIREANYQRAARNADFYTFSDHGKPIEERELPQIEAGLWEFIDRGESWRAEGSFKFVDGVIDTSNQIYLDIEMSYNADLDVYKFYLDGWCDNIPALKAYLGVDDSGEAISFDRTIYIVKEGGKTWQLRDSDGTKTYTEAIEGNTFYSFLMGLVPQNTIDTSYLDDEHMLSYRDRGVDSFRYAEGEKGSVFGYGEGRGYDLRLFGDKPIVYNIGTDITVNGRDSLIFYNFNIFYNKIPDDNPSVADWE
jgi:hypothetical protein